MSGWVGLNLVQTRAFTVEGPVQLSKSPQHDGKPFRSFESTESKTIGLLEESAMDSDSNDSKHLAHIIRSERDTSKDY